MGVKGSRMLGTKGEDVHRCFLGRIWIQPTPSLGPYSPRDCVDIMLMPSSEISSWLCDCVQIIVTDSVWTVREQS